MMMISRKGNAREGGDVVRGTGTGHSLLSWRVSTGKSRYFMFCFCFNSFKFQSHNCKMLVREIRKKHK